MECDDRNPPSLVALQVCLNFCIINEVQYLRSCLADSIFVKKTLVLNCSLFLVLPTSERDVGRYKCRRNESLLTSILNDPSPPSRFTLLITKYIYICICPTADLVRQSWLCTVLGYSKPPGWKQLLKHY